jgi:hypothetical protein
MLCASCASATALFFGAATPVCRIHEAVWNRWQEAAAMRAIANWGWLPETAAMSHRA